jgi:hypothetical protein
LPGYHFADERIFCLDQGKEPVEDLLVLRFAHRVAST